MFLIVFLFLACGLGGVVRYQFSRLNPQFRFPIGTFIVNLLAAFLIGYFYANVVDTTLFLILATGLLGGLGTYSTLNVEFVQLLKHQKILVSYIFLTYGLGLILVWLGLSL